MKRNILALAMAGVLVTSAVYAAGNYSMYPVVGGAALCAGTVTGAGAPFSGVTGQGQASLGSICPLSIPAGPSVVTGTELVPADTGLAGGASPQSVVLPMAALNALPLTFTSLTPATATNVITPAATSGGVVILASSALSPTTVYLPSSPIDGQQFRLSSGATIASLTMATAGGSGQSVLNSPTALTASTTAAYGYLFVYHAANTSWARLQ
jgi:hypothetical protein